MSWADQISNFFATLIDHFPDESRAVSTNIYIYINIC